MINALSLMPLQKIFNDLYCAAKGPLKQGLLQCLTDDSQDKRSRYAKSVIEVKTIWQVDKTVNVNAFYYPTTIDFGVSSKTVDYVSELFKESRSVVVEGIAGQGKSIFLRYLCSKSFNKGENIPVFIQLRHISGNNTIQHLVRDALNCLGIVDDVWVLEYFFRSGRFLFLLDGFDEIDEKYRSETIKTIEEYTHNYKKLKVVISSRPNSDIQHSTIFSIVKIKPLNRNDREKLISKLVDDKAVTKLIIDTLKFKTEVSGVLTTPLLVTLLVITYKSENEIPENLSDFYKALFITLIKRHDKTKPGFIRERKSKLGNIEFEKVFETICFLALSSYKISMTEREFHDFCQKALIAERISNINAESVIDDIARITSLVVLEGGKYYFLHKSICEYFAAQKIAEEPDKSLKYHLYEKFCNTDIPDNWHQTLQFLREIDTYDFSNKLMLPYYAKTFNISLKSPPRSYPPFTKKTFMNFVGNDSKIKIWKMANGYYDARVHISSNNWLVNEYLYDYIKQTFMTFIKNQATEFTLDEMVISSRSGSHIDYVFKSSRAWTAFLSYTNSSAPLKEAYREMMSLINDLAEKKNATKPIFDIKI